MVLRLVRRLLVERSGALPVAHAESEVHSGRVVIGMPGVATDAGSFLDALQRTSMEHASLGGARNVAFLGNHLPRQCGIGAFTTALADAITALDEGVDSFVVAMNDPGKTHDYPSRVRFEIAEGDLAAYRRAADFLNVDDVDVLCMQHEYGIFGGRAGAHVLALLRELRMPIVTTLHTILATPSAAQRAVMDEICELSTRIVVMSAKGAELLSEVHGVPPRKVELIPHGIPSLPPSAHSKQKLGVTDRHVILTFGLLSPDKGVEYVIDALPAIAKAFPNVVYIVLGATHPHVRDREGETYRVMLENRAHRLGVDDNIVFHNRFVTQPELVQFLSAADIYITPYLGSEQITSGTLAFAVGSGKTVVSTPYRYARELLADGRGVLVPWKDPVTIAAEITGLLGDKRRRTEIERRAGAFGRSMTWPVVASAYLRTFQRAVADHRLHAKLPTASVPTMARRQKVLPDINLDHLRTMTDDTGLLQHAVWNVPRYEDGYCLDDNARALTLVALVEDAGFETPAVVRALAARYLSFVHHAYNAANGRFRNFLRYTRQWAEERGSDDAHGRALWALGTVVGRSNDAGRKGLSAELFLAAIECATLLGSPRAWAYTLFGALEYLRAAPDDARVIAVRDVLARRLADLFRQTARPDWPWFEDRLTYANARLAQALILSGVAMEDEDLLTIGLQSLEWLVSVQRTGAGVFAPIGSNGFYVRGGPRAEFDQQPIEACGMVSACLDAHRVTGQDRWVTAARSAFDWFLGHNQLERWLYDAGTGGCRDGLHRDRPNENQGAESTLSFLQALVEMRLAERLLVEPAPRDRGPVSSRSDCPSHADA